jgi:hypothetical protein
MAFKFSDLVGKVIVSAGKSTEGNDELYRIQCLDGYVSLVHWQNCCESVDLEDVVGDERDLVGTVLLAEEISSDEPEVKNQDSYSWTFYKVQTQKGDVTLRFLGTSNGYYSESVDAEWHPLTDSLESE